MIMMIETKETSLLNSDTARRNIFPHYSLSCNYSTLCFSDPLLLCFFFRSSCFAFSSLFLSFTFIFHYFHSYFPTFPFLYLYQCLNLLMLVCFICFVIFICLLSDPLFSSSHIYTQTLKSSMGFEQLCVASTAVASKFGFRGKLMRHDQAYCGRIGLLALGVTTGRGGNGNKKTVRRV